MTVIITHKLAESWITQHGEDYCASKLDMVAAQKASGAKIVSVSGFLSAAIKEDYQTASSGPSATEKAKSKVSKAARQKKIDAEAAARREENEAREADKRAMHERIERARTWFAGHSEEEQARILVQFEATLDKPFLRADFKRAKLDATGVAARFADFVDL